MFSKLFVHAFQLLDAKRAKENNQLDAQAFYFYNKLNNSFILVEIPVFLMHHFLTILPIFA